MTEVKNGDRQRGQRRDRVSKPQIAFLDKKMKIFEHYPHSFRWSRQSFNKCFSYLSLSVSSSPYYNRPPLRSRHVQHKNLLNLVVFVLLLFFWGGVLSSCDRPPQQHPGKGNSKNLNVRLTTRASVGRDEQARNRGSEATRGRSKREEDGTACLCVDVSSSDEVYSVSFSSHTTKSNKD